MSSFKVKVPAGTQDGDIQEVRTGKGKCLKNDKNSEYIQYRIVIPKSLNQL